MLQPSQSAAGTRVVAGAGFLFSLAVLGVYWSSLLTSRGLWTLGTDPLAVSLSVAVSAMAVGVGVAAVGVATETFSTHRRGYLRVMRVCGAVGLVAIGVVLLLSAVAAF